MACWDLDYLLSTLADDGIVTCSPQRPLPAHGALGTTHQSKDGTGRQKQLLYTTQYLAIGLEQGILSSIPTSSLGAHKLLGSSAYDFCLLKNFSGHLNSFRGFQPGSASEAPGNFQKVQIYEPHPVLLSQYF